MNKAKRLPMADYEHLLKINNNVSKTKKIISFSYHFAKCIAFIFFTFIFSLLSFICFSQGIAININGDSAANSAILDLQPDTTSGTTSQGLLIPRMGTTRRPNVTPAEGLLIYNTTTKCFEAFYSNVWQPISCLCKNAPAAAGTISGTATVCPGQNAVLYSVPAISGATNYLWSYSGTGASIVGSSNTVIVYFSGTATSGNLSVFGTNTCGSGTVSGNYAIAVNSTSPNITVEPASVNTCLGSGSESFSVTATGGLSYQWQEYISSWNNLSNAGLYSNVNTATLTITNPTVAMNSNKYRCIVSGSCSPAAISSSALLTVNETLSAPTASTHTTPSINQIVWNWNTVSGATGYKWNTSNDYNSATDMGANTTKTETGLNPNTSYTRYVWAYNTCLNSSATTLTQTSSTFTATGGTITYTDASGLNPRSSPAYSGGYTVHTFTSSGTFTPTNGYGDIEILLVAGGGGGGARYGGGGGAGGLIYYGAESPRAGFSYSVTNTPYTVTVGSGGAGGTMAGANANTPGQNGANTVFGNLTAIGGGGGCSAELISVLNGGSGGGGGNDVTPGTGTSGQGNDGGTGHGNTGTYPYKGGGGGGAGADGQDSDSNNGYGGDGGIGLAYSISGTSIYYAGGGGGGAHNPYSGKSYSSGGLGGGGKSANYGSKGAGTAGTPNTGGGGGSASTDTGGDSSTVGAAGGSGIVIIRYQN
ncbi:MAG: hypothetical protein HGB12_07415 [Bacteroidetes bacterium]|nr:hypothetical protein [Bacteroidota bacterium]